jgi:Protein of unknown function (DUF2934)
MEVVAMNEHSVSLNEELIRSKAYELWQSRGGGFGDPNFDWYQAKEILLEEQRSQLESFVKPVKAQSHQVITLVPHRVSEVQKETSTSSIDAIADQQNETRSSIENTSEKAWKFQETLTINSLKLQAQFARMSIEIQKQAWQEYFKLLKKWL